MDKPVYLSQRASVGIVWSPGPSESMWVDLGICFQVRVAVVLVWQAGEDSLELGTFRANIP